ncbi:MAG: serine hydrolase, partial [Longispora sp.]|nr:serine hydrolase [Longispora sp. (in: high G+C Gram-positive bacteria)]
VPPIGWTAWSLYLLDSGERFGSTNAATERNNTESMIKAWIGTDYVAGVESEGRELTGSERAAISAMIRLSDDNAAETLYQFRGADAVIKRLISECGLKATVIVPGFWSYTQITADDAVTMMACVLGRSATSPLTAWVVDEMRHVAPDGMFGIPQVLPAGSDPAVKNGWTLQSAENRWRLNCLATWDNRILAVLTWYPAKLGQAHGESVCRDVTEQVLTLI